LFEGQRLNVPEMAAFTLLMVATAAVLVVLSQPPDSHATKYVVVEEMEGVVKLAPVPMLLPPEDAVYHLSVPPLHPAAVSVTVPGPHLEALVVVGAAGGVQTA
jgi:hypothetical protein